MEDDTPHSLCQPHHTMSAVEGLDINNETHWPSTVTHACNPSYLGGTERIKIWGQPGQKVLKTPPQPMAGCGGTHQSFQLWQEV
jgi:hypothetical protein